MIKNIDLKNLFSKGMGSETVLSFDACDRFTQINFVADGSFANELFYSFYGREFLHSNSNCAYKCEYGLFYPFSMVGFNTSDKGITIIADNVKPGVISLEKKQDKISFGFGFPTEEGQQINFLCKSHSAYFFDGIEFYRQWYKNRFSSLPKSNIEAKDVFHLRRYFLNKDLSSAYIWDGDNINLEKTYHSDCATFGGVDAGLLFDLAYNPQTKIRCGNLESVYPKGRLLNQLMEQIEHLQTRENCLLFTYTDPYLVQQGSYIDTDCRYITPILCENGDIFRMWGDKQWAPCISQQEWQDYICGYINSALMLTRCKGVYLDEFGHGSQYICRAENHSHGEKFDQPYEESRFLAKLQNTLPNQLWMCEFPPCDSSKIDMDIVMCDTRSLVNIYRFVFPQLKFVRIIGCDGPIGDNLWDVNKSFFNGEGLWLDGDADDSFWYSDKVKKAICGQYEVLKNYSSFFCSDKVRPLELTTENGVVANCFELDGKVLLTFINPKEHTICDKVSDSGFEFVKNLYNSAITTNGGSDWTVTLEPYQVCCALFDKL